MKNLFKLCYQASINLINHDGVEHAGYMSFLTILSLFPFMVFIMAVTGFIGNSVLGSEIISSIEKALPSDLTQALLPRINEIRNGPPSGLITISIIGTIWTASSSFEGLRTILNRVYHVKTLPSYFFRRIRSIVEFLIVSILLIVGTAVLVWLPYLLDVLQNLLSGSHSLNSLFIQIGKMEYYLTGLSRMVFIFLILFLSISFIYYQIPNTKMSFSQQVPGTVLVIILWYLCAQGLRLYFTYFNQVNIIYGSLVGIIAALLFFFFIHMILIWGAEFNYLLMLTNQRKSQRV